MLEVVYHLMGLQKILITTEYTTATMNQVRYVLKALLRTSSLPTNEGNILLSSWLISLISMNLQLHNLSLVLLEERIKFKG